MLYATKEQFSTLLNEHTQLIENAILAKENDDCTSVSVLSFYFNDDTKIFDIDATIEFTDGSTAVSTYMVSLDQLYEQWISSTAGRPDWDEIWMTFAGTIAQRSIDDRRKVGAIIVSENNSQVLALGYNGDYKGGPNAVLSSLPGQSGCIHAEINALLKLDFNYPGKKRMYVTTMPCYQCAAACINTGIDEVIYRDDYRDDAGIKILKASGVLVRKFGV